MFETRVPTNRYERTLAVLIPATRFPLTLPIVAFVFPYLMHHGCHDALPSAHYRTFESTVNAVRPFGVIGTFTQPANGVQLIFRGNWFRLLLP